MEPNYYAVIPAEVRYADISANAKLLYGELTALCNREGYCWASNAYFAKLYKVSNVSVSRWMSELNAKKFIKVELKKSGPGHEFSRKIVLTKLLRPTSKLLRPHNKNVKGGINKIVKYNNTSINNTNNILMSNNKNSSTEIQEIFDLFITKFGKNPGRYKLTPARYKKIQLRLNDAGAEMLTEAITKIAKSQFHRGDNDRGWEADLDFIIRSYEQVERLSNLDISSKSLKEQINELTI